jgi:CBS domain-containing protein
MATSAFALASGMRRLRSATASSQAIRRHIALDLFSPYCKNNPVINQCNFRLFASAAPQSSEEVEALENIRSGQIVSKEDVHQEETQRRRLSDVLISEVLDAKHAYRWVDPIIKHDATLKEAIEAVIDGGLSGMMVVEIDENQHKKVLGLLTSRDLLRIMAGGIKDDESNDEIMNRAISDLMTPISQMVFARPQETIGMCRTIMAKLGIKCLPILTKGGQVAGLITAKDMADFGLTASDKGGKKNYLNDISERVGLSSNTSMAEPPTFMLPHLGLEQSPLFVNVAVAELPHPFKTDTGVSGNRRGKPTNLYYNSFTKVSSHNTLYIFISLPHRAWPTGPFHGPDIV